MVDIESILKSVDKARKYSPIIFLFTLAFFITPLGTLEMLGLSGFMVSYKSYFGMMLYGSGCLTIYSFIESLYAFLKRIMKSISEGKAKERNVIAEKKIKSNVISGLTDTEKAVLKLAVTDQKKTLTAHYNDEICLSMMGSGVIIRASNLTVGLESCVYLIQPWAWSIINDDMSILD